MATQTDEERVLLTPEQAIAMLPDGERIHTFRNPGGMLLGADWPREKLEQAIHAANTRELAGVLATGMGHGLCIEHDHRPLYVATKRNEQ
jgi:hypothetical protein